MHRIIADCHAWVMQFIQILQTSTKDRLPSKPWDVRLLIQGGWLGDVRYFDHVRYFVHLFKWCPKFRPSDVRNFDHVRYFVHLCKWCPKFRPSDVRNFDHVFIHVRYFGHKKILWTVDVRYFGHICFLFRGYVWGGGGWLDSPSPSPACFLTCPKFRPQYNEYSTLL